jgi:hypothetical protein
MCAVQVGRRGGDRGEEWGVAQQEPSSQEPSSQEPSSQEPSSQEPSSQEPSSQEPSSYEPSNPWARPGSPAGETPLASPAPYLYGPPAPYPYGPPRYGQVQPPYGPPGQPPYGPPGQPPYGPPVQQGPPPPRDAYQLPARVDPIPGTPFGLLYLKVPAGTSGPAVGSQVTGIASILVGLVVACLGLSGARQGWGAWVAGAFAVLAVVLGVAGIGLALTGLRQVRRPPAPGTVQVTGRGLAIAGLSCGSAGLAVTVLALGIVLIVQLG